MRRYIFFILNILIPISSIGATNRCIKSENLNPKFCIDDSIFTNNLEKRKITLIQNNMILTNKNEKYTPDQVYSTKEKLCTLNNKINFCIGEKVYVYLYNGQHTIIALNESNRDKPFVLKGKGYVFNSSFDDVYSKSTKKCINHKNGTFCIGSIVNLQYYPSNIEFPITDLNESSAILLTGKNSYQSFKFESMISQNNIVENNNNIIDTEGTEDLKQYSDFANLSSFLEYLSTLVTKKNKNIFLKTSKLLKKYEPNDLNNLPAITIYGLLLNSLSPLLIESNSSDVFKIILPDYLNFKERFNKINKFYSLSNIEKNEDTIIFSLKLISFCLTELKESLVDKNLKINFEISIAKIGAFLSKINDRSIQKIDDDLIHNLSDLNMSNLISSDSTKNITLMAQSLIKWITN